MRFGRKMDHGVNLSLAEEVLHQSLVLDISLNECVPFWGGKVSQVFKRTGVGQRV